MSEPQARVRALGGAPWRGTDAAEAHRATLGELGADHWPVLPELPDRGPGADATGRSAALLAEISVDLQPHGWRVSPPSAVASGMDRRRARSHWREDAQRWADTAGAEGVDVPRLAVRVRGPLTLLGELWLPGGERALIDVGARRDLAEAYRVGLGEALADLRATTGAQQLGVILDEPRAAAVLAGELATASGFRTVRSLPRDEARRIWRDALTDLVHGGMTQVWLDPHSSEAHVRDLAVLVGECLPPRVPGGCGAADDADGADSTHGTRSPVGLVLDVGALEPPAAQDAARSSRSGTVPSRAASPAAWEVAAGWSDAGRRIGLRPGRDREAAPAGLLRTWDRLGLDPALARGITLAASGPAGAAALARLRRDAEELDERVGELL